MSSHNIFGSIKDKMSRKKSDANEKLPKSSDAPSSSQNISSSWNPFLSPSSAAQPQASSSVNPEEPPPAYSSVAGSSSALPPGGRRLGSPSPSLTSVTTQEDKYAFLSSFKSPIVVDDSGSMAGRSWREVRDALSAIVPVCTAHDPEGIDLYFLNHNSGVAATATKPGGGYIGIRDAETVQQIFESVTPGGATPTGTRLNRILKPYLSELDKNRNNMENVKPINVIVITDGVPTDDPESIIVHYAKKLDKLDAPPHQVGIQFFQVGREPGAREALCELDDGLAELGIRDMVDTVTWDSTGDFNQRSLTADGILKVVLGAVVRRIDRKASGASAGVGSSRR